MKKLLAIVTLASVMTACNNSGEEKAAATDSPKVETPVTDAVKTADSAANQMMNKVTDSVGAKVNQVADSAKKGVNKVIEKAKEAVKH